MKQLWGCVVGLACLVGSAATAQSLEPLITGTWIGGLEADGQFEFYAATIEHMGSLAGTATVPMRGLSGPLRSSSLEGNRIRIAGPASLTLSGIVSGDVITGDFEAQGGRSRGRFRLSRIPSVKTDQLNRYQGAYRFSDGAMLLDGHHNLMDMSGAASTEFARLDRFVPGLFESMASWLVQRVQPR